MIGWYGLVLVWFCFLDDFSCLPFLRELLGRSLLSIGFWLWQIQGEEWTDKRNTLLLLSQSCDSYPLVEKYARGVLQCVENVRDREKANDLKTLANSLAVKLKACATWIFIQLVPIFVKLMSFQ